MFDLFNKLLGKSKFRQGLGLALYGPRTDRLDLLEGVDWMQEWAARLSLPSAEWVSINYGGQNDRQYKSYKFDAWNKQGRPLPDSLYTSVEIGRYLEGSKGGMTDDIWYACFVTETHPELVFVLDLNESSPSDEDLVELVSESQVIAGFDYGYVFHMPMEHSLVTYINGLVFGNPGNNLTRVQEDEINKWGNARGACNSWLDDTISRYLRDIYPLNFLNPGHLAMQVKGQTLKNWIECDPKHGFLQPIIEGRLWTWTVPKNHIRAIRKVLGVERLLISWGDFNTPSGGPLGHTYGSKQADQSTFNGLVLSEEEQRWIADGLAAMAPIFERYTGEKFAAADRFSRELDPRFPEILDAAFTTWSQDVGPERPAPEQVGQAFAATLGEYLIERYRMTWYAVEDEYGRSLGVCHRGKGDAQTWTYPIDVIAKRIDRKEIGFIPSVVEAIGNEIERG